jgi:large subunit ribosomal protein L24
MAYKKEIQPVKIRIKKGDTVLVLSGDDKNKTGVIKEVIREKYRAIVTGVNMVKRHVKPTAERTGGVEQREASIHISNLMLVDANGVASRVTTETREGTKVRVSKKTGAIIADPHKKSEKSETPQA